MIKVDTLYKFLSTELLDYRQRLSDIHVYAQTGTTKAYLSDDNDNFILSYQAVIVLEKSTYGAAHISYLLLRWLKEHQAAWLKDAVLAWDVEIINPQQSNLLFYVDLTETIIAHKTGDAIQLETAGEPHRCAPIDDASLSLSIRHRPRLTDEKQFKH